MSDASGKTRRADYLIFQHKEGNRTLLWLQIQHVSLTVAGHQTGATPSFSTSQAETYLLPVTLVAAVNYRPEHTDGDYAVYIGVGLPEHRSDPVRAAYIAMHGNKVERSLAEHLFRKPLNKWFGKDIIRYRE